MISRTPRFGRDTRLLLLTIAVSMAMLLLLARFRFPAEVRQEAAPAPLQRLAARATYDELANIIAQLETRLVPQIVVLRLSGGDTAEDRATLDLLRPPHLRTGFPRFVPALRVRENAALMLLEPSAEVRAIVGHDETPPVLAVDPVRRLALVQVPPMPEASWRWDRADTLRTPSYVALVEGTRGGPTIRPVFLGRTDPVTGPKWERSLLVVGGTLAAEPGSLVFSLDGRFVGLTVFEEGLLAVAPAEMLVAAAEQLARGDIPPAGDLGVLVQPLTRAVGAATGANTGVIVAHVDPDGPAAGHLEVGAAIEAVDGEPVFTPDGFRVRVARTSPGSTVTLQVRNGGEPHEVPVVIGAQRPRAEPEHGTELGLVMREVEGVGAQVLRVAAGSAAGRCGLTPGDIVTRFDGTVAPTPADIGRGFAEAPAGRAMLLAVERDGRPLVLGLEKP